MFNSLTNIKGSSKFATAQAAQPPQTPQQQLHQQQPLPPLSPKMRKGKEAFDKLWDCDAATRKQLEHEVSKRLKARHRRPSGAYELDTKYNQRVLRERHQEMQAITGGDLLGQLQYELQQSEVFANDMLDMLEPYRLMMADEREGGQVSPMRAL